MTEDPDTLRARLDRLAALVELAAQLPPEDRTIQFVSLARQEDTQARQPDRTAAREAADPDMTDHDRTSADE